MNARQAAKAAAKTIAELTDFNRRCSADIKAYNQCIDGMIAGESPCPWCMEYPECQREVKDNKGCSEWWLKDVPVTEGRVVGGDEDEVLTVVGADGQEAPAGGREMSSEAQ